MLKTMKTNFYRKNSIEQKITLFYHFLEEGWSVTCSKGRARITQTDHQLIRATNESYASLFKQSYLQAMERKKR